MRARLALVVALLGACGHDAVVNQPDMTPTGPCAGAPLTKGPYAMRMTATGVSVYWESATPQSCVEIGVTPEAGGAETIASGAQAAGVVSNSYGIDMVPFPDIAGTYYLSRVDVTGLAPGACYAYRVRSSGDGGAGESGGRICTGHAASAQAPWKFFAIGDTNPLLGHTATVLKYTLVEKPDFAMHMGDISYYSSTETWAYWFRAMAPMLEIGAFLPAVGNHENETMYEATEYADFYDRLFHQPSLDGTPEYYRFSSGGIYFHSIDTEVPFDSAAPQYQWLVTTLKDSAAQPDFRFSVVYMHRPLYTLGDVAPLVDSRKDLTPIFESNKVRLVIAGHMHGYERFEVGDITYITTAGGGGVINDVNMNVPNYPMDVPLRVAAFGAYHAMLFTVTPMGSATSIRGRAIDEFGKTIDDFTHVIQ